MAGFSPSLNEKASSITLTLSIVFNRIVLHIWYELIRVCPLMNLLLFFSGTIFLKTVSHIVGTGITSWDEQLCLIFISMSGSFVLMRKISMSQLHRPKGLCPSFHKRHAKLWTAQLQKLRWSIEFNSKAINHSGRDFWSISSCELVSISDLHVLTSCVPDKLFFVLIQGLPTLTWHKHEIKKWKVTCCRICTTDAEQKSQSNSTVDHF